MVQLRHILEEDAMPGESRVFTMARNVYKVRTSVQILAMCIMILCRRAWTWTR